MNYNYKRGFTIVELLIVVVVMAILAAITIVTYKGINQSAIVSSLKSDIRNTAMKLDAHKIDQGEFPTILGTNDKAESPTNTVSYQADVTSYCISATTKKAGGPSFFLNNDGTIQSGSCSLIWTQVSTGGYHSVAIASNGAVYTWGLNSGGQLGDGTTTNRSSPVIISSAGPLADKTVTQVIAGAGQSFALTSDNKLYAWGGNGVGQLGDGTTTNRSTPVDITSSGALSGKTIKQLSVGESHVLAVATDGKVYSWGANSYGRLGDGTSTNRSVPVAVTTTGVLAGKMIAQVSAGGLHSLALGTDGKVYSWGGNTNGQIGDATANDRYTPVAVSTTGVLAGKTITQTNASFANQSFALASDGTGYSWGMNTQGQLGNNTTVGSSSPVAVYTAGALVATPLSLFAAGYDHTLALGSSGTVFSWGRNVYGQIGDGSVLDTAVPLAISSTIAGKVIKQLGAGYYSSEALGYNGVIYSWGRNTYGQLGDGTTNDRSSPEAIPAP